MIALAIHELATNAVKHGSLSVPDGKVMVEWTLPETRDDLLRVDWSETGGPAVDEPKRIGFGHTVIRDMFARALTAEVQMNFSSSGFAWSARIPLSAVSVDTAETIAL
jgi:two-component sensor histidine kinase